MSRKGHRIGLKLFSTNVEAIPAAKKLYKKKCYDYIELMAIPDTKAELIERWEGLGIPYIVHAPHWGYGFNLASADLFEHNVHEFDCVRRLANRLRARYIIVHAGVNGTIDETIRQIKILNDARIIVENKPCVTAKKNRCVGSSFTEVKTLMDQTNSGFCLDVVHAVKAAVTHGMQYMDYLRLFLSLNPAVVHIADCNISNQFDEHMSLGLGDLDIPMIISLIVRSIPSAHFTLEVPEKSYTDLKQLEDNSAMLARYI